MKETNSIIQKTLQELGLKDINNGTTTGTKWLETNGETTSSVSPINGKEIAKIKNATAEDYEKVMKKAEEAFLVWRKIPAPKRAEVVRQIGNALREKKDALGRLVTIEMGKIYQEGLGEVQEMIDICDFAVGQARLMNGFVFNSERPMHKMHEQYHPLGIVGIITSFNFPVAVWAWNTMIASAIGNVVIWKPSSKTPLTAIATQNIIQQVLSDNDVPEGVFNLVIAKSSVLGNSFMDDSRIPLVSVTGSTAVGKKVNERVAKRLGKTILELGGNNAVILTKEANLKLAIPSIVFGSVGTAGQRCTSTRRIIIHESIYEDVKSRLVKAYEQVEKKIGNPLDENVLVGPVIDQFAVDNFNNAIKAVKEQGGKVIFGGRSTKIDGDSSDFYLVPAIAEAENHYEIVQHETFAPLLYLIKYTGDVSNAIDINNDVPQGLSSAIFTENMHEQEIFLGATGSDCGISNVNIGTSGAEIGGAFGGEKDTGGGRESGSDAWKAYARRQTNTINYGFDLPLAQGIKFELD